MPRYNFHSVDGFNPAGDADGRELPDDDAAMQEARTAAAEALQEDVSLGADTVRVVVTVHRSDGSRLGVVTMHANVERFPAQ